MSLCLNSFVQDCRLKQYDLVWLQMNPGHKMTCNISMGSFPKKIVIHSTTKTMHNNFNLLVFCTGNFKKPCASQATKENNKTIDQRKLAFS